MPDINFSYLPKKPGVYLFFDATKKILYVGKAKDLKKRVSRYFQKNITDKKTKALVEKIASFEITVTDSENQALLLESNLIKTHHPKYNILFRDDKSYPYLFLSEGDFPRLDYHRGAKKEKGHYFGPYPNAGSVRENLAFIQKLFQLRQCRDVFFKNRSRPCLQYQIQRCTAPCVGYVSAENYQQQVDDAVNFLSGKNNRVMASLELRMTAASEKKDYEMAVHWRDLLIRLRKLQAQQFVIGDKGNVDIFGVAEKLGDVAISVVSVRNGYLLGHKTFFPTVPAYSLPSEILSAFISQYYLSEIHAENPVDCIVLKEKMIDQHWIKTCLKEQWQKRVTITTRSNAATRAWQSIADNNAKQALLQHQSDKNHRSEKWEALQNVLGLQNKPERLECFDISHTLGEATKASCVVFNEMGPVKKAYRQFNIENITPGDDYAAMTQALTRRYTHLKMQNLLLPDVVIIDGGKGQLNAAKKVMESLQLNDIVLLGVAKGESRKAGREKLFVLSNEQRSTENQGNNAKIVELTAGLGDPARHLIQHIRDEAHRFAITAHRKARGKNRLQSVLDTIAGIGKKRKTNLLNHFGGLSELKKASVEEIAEAKGISQSLAKNIYRVLHE